jgi:hypothetical protein
MMAPIAPNIASPLAMITVSLGLVCCCATDCKRNAIPVDKNSKYKSPSGAANSQAVVIASRPDPIARQTTPQAGNCTNMNLAAL